MIYKRGCNKKGLNGACSKCGKRRACGVYWYKFMWNGEQVRESTKQGNDKVARHMEAAHRTALAKGEVGIREKKTVLTLADFCSKRFAPWAESTSSLKTWRDFYRVGLLAIAEYRPLSSLALDTITTERICEFASHRQTRRLPQSTPPFASFVVFCGLQRNGAKLKRYPKVKLLPGECHRERIISSEEQAHYLASTSPLLG
jgi:hypothetical protein